MATVFTFVALIHWSWSHVNFDQLWRRSPDWVFASSCGLMLPIYWLLQDGGLRPFMYFQF